MNICLNCQTTTSNPKFCNLSCAVSHNNKKKSKRQVEGSCKCCGDPIRSKLVYCSDCKTAKHISEKTISQALYKEGANKYQRIRHHARNKWLKPGSSCFICGYSVHVEVCHIKPIYSFPLDTKVKDVNAQNNVVLLCPNHHWEFDNGLLILDDLVRPSGIEPL